VIRQALEPVRIVARANGVLAAEAIGEGGSVSGAFEQRFSPRTGNAPGQADVQDGLRPESIVQDGAASRELVFDRLLISVERALRDPADQMRVIEAATQVAVTVSRVVALAAVARASRERAARTREEMAQRQLRDVLDKQKATIQRLEHELKQDFR